MKTIYILGFGCGGKHDITLRTLEILKESDRVYARTLRHPSAEILDEYGIECESFDSLYETADDFEALYEKISDTVVSSEGEKISYIVPGSSFIAERAVGLIVRKADCEVVLVPAVSFIDGIFSAMKTDAADSFKLLDALSLDTQKPDPGCLNIICQMYDRDIASDVKLALSEYYPDDTPVYIVNEASTENERILEMPLYEIDRTDDIDHLTSLVIPPRSFTEAPRSFGSLRALVECLRSDEGCPWDRSQTLESMARYLTEEAWEAVDAIEKSDPDSLCEELGDLLFEITMLSRISEEYGDFSVSDVIEGIVTKMVARHPHVFAGGKAPSGDTDAEWDEIKRKEHSYERASEELGDVARALPALSYMSKLLRKTDKYSGGRDLLSDAGFSCCSDLSGLSDEELKKEAARRLTGICRVLSERGMDAESILKEAAADYIGFVSRLEKMLAEYGLTLSDASGEKYDNLIQKSKSKSLFL